MIRILYLLLIASTIVVSGCKKYLDKKPKDNLAIPSSLKDLQAILDNSVGNSGTPGDMELQADNYYVTSSSWNNTIPEERDAYVWAPNAPSPTQAWDFSYYNIYNANFVLDYIDKISFPETERGKYKNIKGGALFYRAFHFLQLAQYFCKPYSPSANTDPGIVVRTTSDVNQPVSRATVQQTYDQVINDLKTAAELLPVTNPFATQPNKVAAYGTLARTYLSMRDYTNAKTYSRLALDLYNRLLDFNSLTPVTNPVIPPVFINNPEVIFFHKMNGLNYLMGATREALIDSTLYNSYQPSDIRKKAFFVSNGTTAYFNGSYGGYLGTYLLFDGIATDELYLVQAESLARTGEKDNAMAALNTLLRSRWQTGTFTDLTATDANDALNKILIERRKELLYRGLRWSDLRRFNLENANITLKRIVNGITYTLPPNDLRWVGLIPPNEISRSGIPQNQR